MLSLVGEVALAVTTDLTIHFLSRPAQKDVLAEDRLLKLGRRLAIGEVIMHSEGDGRAICHAVGTYAIPAGRGRRRRRDVDSGRASA